MKVSVIGAGTMGAGIAQIAATKGHEVCLYDSFDGVIETAENKLKKILNRLVEKERISQSENEAILDRINFSNSLENIKGSELVIEAIIENLEIKQKVFAEIESLVDDNCIIASNTSSLSIASIASSCKKAERVVGIHFFNPAPLMPLVEIIPAVQTSEDTLNKAKSIIDSAYPQASKPRRLTLSQDITPDDVSKDVWLSILNDKTYHQDEYDKRIDRLKAIRTGAWERYQFFNDKNSRLANTPWGAWQAVVETEDFRKGHSNSATAIFGMRAEAKSRAFKTALELCK